jgi:phosphoribosylformimino-5-aminoimidazole carboxamide ribotide isomerase
MLIIPAIDLKDCCVVRFVQGRLNKKIYSCDPLKTARHWVEAGAKLLHIVDLDGAFTGTPKNLSLVKEIVKNIGVPAQFGGGVRKIEAIEKLLNLGIWRVVLGTKAVIDKSFLKKANSLFGDKIIVSLDIEDNFISIKGWKNIHKETDAIAFAKTLKGMGLKQLIYTDILKDGTLTGPNIKGIKIILKETGLKLIASGGISSLDDIRKLKPLEKQGLLGVIVGKALYEGKFTLSQAIKLGARLDMKGGG